MPADDNFQSKRTWTMHLADGGRKLVTRHDWHTGFTDEIQGTATTVHKLVQS
jgi:hypothetical protein